MKLLDKTSSTPRTRNRLRLICRILVPVDFSDCSLAGLKFAVRFAKEVGAGITVLHVADLGPVMMTTACGNYDSPTYTKAARRRSGKQMRAFLKRVDFDGVPVHTSAVAGCCPTAIHEAAAKERADLIMISMHGRTGLRRAFLGSVAECTVRSAACPVVVVPSFAKTRKKVRQKEARRSVKPCNKVGEVSFEQEPANWLENFIGPTSPPLESNKSLPRARARNAW